jgi:hypothetical protein
MKVMVILIVAWASTVNAQVPASSSTEKQQRALHDQATRVIQNMFTFIIEAYPGGIPYAQRDNVEKRRDAWSPRIDAKDTANAFNDGMGCVIVIPGKDVCAPPDLQARLTMETLREHWDNTKEIPASKIPMMSAFRDSVANLFYQEKVMFCVLRPEANYIDLTDTLMACTPEK